MNIDRNISYIEITIEFLKILEGTSKDIKLLELLRKKESLHKNIKEAFQPESSLDFCIRVAETLYGLWLEIRKVARSEKITLYDSDEIVSILEKMKQCECEEDYESIVTRSISYSQVEIILLHLYAFLILHIKMKSQFEFLDEMNESDWT